MTTYSIVLFLHVASALGLLASLSFELLSLFHLRPASDLPGVRRRIDPVPGLPVLAMSSILVVFFSGISPAVRMSAFETAWPKVTIAALLLIALRGPRRGDAMGVGSWPCAKPTARGARIPGTAWWPWGPAPTTRANRSWPRAMASMVPRR